MRVISKAETLWLSLYQTRMLFNHNFLSYWISCSHWWKWNKIKLRWWRGCHERIGKESKYYTGTTFGPFACGVSHKPGIVEPVPSVLEDRDARTKTGWSLTGLGPDQDHQNFEPDQDQEKFQNLVPDRTRTGKFSKSRTGPGPTKFCYSPTYSDQPVLGPCGLWILNTWRV